MELSHLYARRFSELNRERKARAWTALCRGELSRWIRPGDTVLDLGAGYCEFINAVEARRRVAVDINPETAGFAAPGVEVHVSPVEELSFLADGEIDVVFSSNFLEHLSDKRVVAEVVRAAHRVLRPGGRLVVMGPNARLVRGAYWDFFDHHVPLTDRSICELLRATGFEIRVSRARFVPYTVLRWPFPVWPWMVRAYLALMPISSLLLGRQFLVVAVKPDIQPSSSRF
jgi:SAM-dependent methyltransferase